MKFDDTNWKEIWGPGFLEMDYKEVVAGDRKSTSSLPCWQETGEDSEHDLSFSSSQDRKLSARWEETLAKNPS